MSALPIYGYNNRYLQRSLVYLGMGLEHVTRRFKFPTFLLHETVTSLKNDSYKDSLDLKMSLAHISVLHGMMRKSITEK